MAFLEIGTSAPVFKGQNLTGPEFSLEAVKGKRGIVLIFSPDQVNPAQTNIVKGAYDKNKSDVEFVTMIRQIPSVTMAKMFLQQLGVKFPVVYDKAQEVYKTYGVEKPVVIYSITPEGNVAGVVEIDPRGVTAQALEEAVAKAKANGNVPLAS
jgi:peroxiredoxin